MILKKMLDFDDFGAACWIFKMHFLKKMKKCRILMILKKIFDDEEDA